MTRAQRITQTETQLAEVQAAISQVLRAGQAFGAENRQRSNADLRALQEREEYLEAKLSRLRRGGTIQTYGVVVD